MLQAQELPPSSPSSAASLASGLPSLPTDQAVEALRRILVGRTVADVERHLILGTLASCHGNRTHAARILGISIRTLRNKLNEYLETGISVPEPGQKPPLA